MPNNNNSGVDISNPLLSTGSISTLINQNGGLAGKAPEPKETMSAVKIAADRSQRFRIKLTQKEVEKQLNDRDKILGRIKLPQFEPKNEKDYEDWLDQISGQITRSRLCLQLFQEAWMAVSSTVLAQRIDLIDDAETHEELVDKLAQVLFPVSKYPREVEDLLLTGRRQATVLEAEHWCHTTASRYLRLCQRHDWQIGVTDDRYLETVFASLPQQIEAKIREIMDDYTVESVIKKAYKLEAEIVILPYSQPTMAMPAREDGFDNSMSDARQRAAAKKLENYSCRSCGVKGQHWRSKCPDRNTRCATCEIIGHKSSVCRSTVKKDELGRVKTRVIDSPSGTLLEARTDRTQADRLSTAENVLKVIQKIAMDKSERSKAKREKKKQDNNWKAKKNKIEHPVQRIVELENTTSSESDDDTFEQISEALKNTINICQPATPEEKAPIVWTSVCINGQTKRAVADSGAGRSICSRPDAINLGLQMSTSHRQFKGLGRCSGQVALPVLVTLGSTKRSALIEFHVVEQVDCDMLISLSDLDKFDVYIDPRTRSLIDRNSYEIVAASLDYEVQKEQKSLISGVDEKASDEELLNKAYDWYRTQTEHLESDKMEELWKIFVEHKECWLRPRSGQFKKFKGNFTAFGDPCKDKIRPLPEPLKAELDHQLDEMLKHGIVRPSKSPWGSVPVFAKKKTGGWRMALDYRRLNKQLKNDSYPIPNCWENLQLAAHHQYYTTLDCQWGFWNVPLEEECKELTAIITYRGTFEFNVLPFGIKTSPSIFQRAMDSIFHDLYYSGALVYIDDVIIYHNVWNDHLKGIANILKRCMEASICINFQKGSFAQSKVEHLGHQISFYGIQPSPKKVEALRCARAPQDKQELHSFLGLSVYVSRFIPHFSTIVAPLQALLKKGATYKWNEVCDNAFQLLKESICEQVMLTAPRGNEPFIIVTDASQTGIGCALMQLQEGELALLEFGAKKLSPAEQRWDTREREAYAIKFAVQHFTDYVKASEIIILSDHESLRWMAGAKSGKVQRWSLFLQQYDIALFHIQGNNNVIADYLSRSLEDDVEQDKIVDIISVPTFPVLQVQLRNTNSNHKIWAPYVPNVEDLTKAYDSMTKEEVNSTTLAPDGMRYSVRTRKLFIPSPLRDVITYWFHASRYGGHGGVNKTLKRMQKWVWWIGMAQYVQDYVKNCLICIRQIIPQPIRLFRSVLTKPLPLQMISIDHVGPIQWCGEEIHYAVIIDHASRFIVARKCPPTMQDSINVLKTSWCHIFQAPNAVLTDRGSAFLSGFHHFITEELMAYHVYTSPYYPQGNSINEAAHKALEKSIGSNLIIGERDFDEVLSLAVAVHNSCPHSSLGISPFCSLFGFEPTLPGWQKYRDQNDGQLQRIRQREHRQQHLLRSQLSSDDFKVSHATDIQEGDWVVYFASKYERAALQIEQSSQRYSPLWSLPAKVTSVRNGVIEVQNWGSNGPPRQVALTQVRKLEGSLPPSLQTLTLKLMEFDHPRAVKPRLLPGRTTDSRSWNDVLVEASQPRKKHKVQTKEKQDEPVPPLTT